jgi:hypothetical protein
MKESRIYLGRHLYAEYTEGNVVLSNTKNLQSNPIYLNQDAQVLLAAFLTECAEFHAPQEG